LMLLQFIANGIVNGAIFAILALGFGLVYNTTHTFHIAYAAIYTTSAYVCYTLYRITNLPLWLSILGGLTSGVILGCIIELLVYRPLVKRDAPLSVALISSIGVYIIVINIIALIYGNETKILLPGIQKTYQLGSVILTQIQVIELIIGIVVCVAYSLLLRTTNFGKLIRALADNPNLLSAFGVDIYHVRLQVFALSSLLASIAACLVALDVGIDPYVGMPAMLISAVSMIVGGVGIFVSPALGGLLLGIIQSLAIWKISARWQDLVTFAILIIFLLLRPQGIMGRRRRLEEL